MLNIFQKKDNSLFYIIIFSFSWLFLGNLWSILATFGYVYKSTLFVVLNLIFYLFIILPIIYFCFKEIFLLNSKIKWIILITLAIFALFIIPPPRNADSMRVWLAKVNDVWMNGQRLFRPYWHYNTPDAFTIFHLPFIKIFDGQIFQLSIFTALSSILLLLIKIARLYDLSDNKVGIILCLLIFNPLIILSSTVITTDMPMILSVTGIVYSMILIEKTNNKISWILLFLFFSLGMNIKFNMIMFSPLIGAYTLVKIWQKTIPLKIFVPIIILLLLAIYPYLMNYLRIYNPVWPALASLFPHPDQFFNEVAINNASIFNDKRTIWAFIQSLYTLFIYPQSINPLAMLCVLFVFRKFKYIKLLPLFYVVSYFFLLWVMMPRFVGAERERYVLYIFPVIIPFGVLTIYEYFDRIKKINLKRIFEFLLYITVIIYSAFILYYSKDTLKYIITGDKNEWHKATWYYEDYDWINNNIKFEHEKNNILVIVSAELTYYLKKPYINGDCLSALIDWRKMDNINSLSKMLIDYKIEYLYLDYSIISGNSDIINALNILKNNKVLEEIRENKIKICKSRIRNQFEEHRTILYKVNK